MAAGSGSLVGAEELPPSLEIAMATADREQIRHPLEELDKSEELYVFKTHAEAHDLFDTQCRAILIVRDGRDALTSYAHYLVGFAIRREGVPTPAVEDVAITLRVTEGRILDSPDQDHLG